MRTADAERHSQQRDDDIAMHRLSFVQEIKPQAALRTVGTGDETARHSGYLTRASPLTPTARNLAMYMLSVLTL